MAAAVAAHECGHAVQHARAYAPLTMRSKLVPVVSFDGVQAETVLAVRQITLGLSARPCPCCFLHTHEIFGLYFFSLPESATLERIPPPLWAGKLVLVGQKTFCRTRTQLALFA